MAVRPEYLRLRLRFGNYIVNETEKAADLLEGVIDQHIRGSAQELVFPGFLSFPLVPGTNREVVEEVLLRYRSVGWEVDLRAGDDCEELCFRLAQGEDRPH